MMSTSRQSVLLALVLLAITSLVYWPGLSGGFIFDDYPNIVTNTSIHAKSLSYESLRDAANAYEPGSYGRPLATISFAIDYAIGGKDAWVYKCTSLIVHLINCLLVFQLARMILALPGNRRPWSIWAPFAIALIWAIHPLQISSVLYVVQRMETLSATFVLLALIAYIRGRNNQRTGAIGWHWLLASALSAACGMLSKETAVLFPVYALALEATLLNFEARASRTRQFLIAAYATGAVAAIAIFAFILLPQYTDPQAFDGRTFTLNERLLTQLRVLPMYLGQMFLPLPSSLSFYYDTYPKSLGLLNPISTLIGGVFLLGLFSCGILLRKRAPLMALGILWFFAAHLLTSNVFNLELAFEHRNYFALLGMLLVSADLVHRIPLRDGPELKYAAVTVVALGFGFLAILRSATWGNELQLSLDLVAKNPTSPRASSDLATYFVGISDSNPQSPFYSLGKAEFERGSRLPDASPLPEQGLILMAATTGEPVEAEWWDRLVYKIRTRPTGPQEVLAVSGLMKQRYRGIALEDARLSEAYAALLARPRMPARMFAQYGDYALEYLKDDELADRMFIAAIERDPKDSAYARKIVSTLVLDGHTRQANAVLARAMALGLIGKDPR